MKKLMIGLLMMFSATQAYADFNTGYLPLLVERDIMRVFWSPCSGLGRVETQELQDYEEAGFQLVAVISMPLLDNKGRSIPRCQYTFVRKSHLN